MQTRLLSALFFAAAFLIGCASMSMSSSPVKTMDGMYVGQNGMTLYTFDRDTAGSGKSVCNGGCPANWPPFMAADSDKPMGDWTIITRDDGKKQWAYKGKPLYFFAKDMKAGDKMGDGFLNGAWHVVRP